MVSFPVKPTVGQDPWGPTFLAWGSAVESNVGAVETVANAAATQSSVTALAGRVSTAEGTISSQGTRLSATELVANAALPVKGALGAVDLNTVLSTGVYFQATTSNATLALNYPVAAKVTEISVVSTGNTVVQRATLTQAGVSDGLKGFYQRGYTVSTLTWGSWQFIPSQRVDVTAGRAIYTWDNLANREQLIYGDTGWRDITSLLINGWTATAIYMKRDTYVVTFVVEGLNASAMTNIAFIAPPSGFVPQVLPNTSPRALLETLASPAVSWRVSYTGGNLALAGATTSLAPLSGVLRFKTVHAWPTTLPGTAVGSIPNL